MPQAAHERPCLSSVSVGELEFSSDFDSGNAMRVEQVDDHEFALWTANDCEGTEFEKSYRTVRSLATRMRACEQAHDTPRKAAQTRTTAT